MKKQVYLFGDSNRQLYNASANYKRSSFLGYTRRSQHSYFGYFAGPLTSGSNMNNSVFGHQNGTITQGSVSIYRYALIVGGKVVYTKTSYLTKLSTAQGRLSIASTQRVSCGRFTTVLT